MTGSIWDWSTTAASNGNADAGINFAEGQAPSTVNDSARQVMGRVAEFRKDLGGATSAAGTANALTLTANSAFTALADGQIVVFRAIADNAAGVTTINVNSIAAKSIRKMVGSGETDLAAGDIKNGGIFVLRYGASFNGAAGAWMLQNPVIDLPSLVTLTGSQTLTNKTLTSPIVSGGTIDNAPIGSTTPSTIAGTSITGTSITDSGKFALTGVISPAALAAGNTNNYAPAGLATASTLRLSANGAGSTLTGLTAQSGGTVLIVSNVGSGPLVLAGQNGSSTTANQFLNTAPVIILPGQSSALQYDGTSNGWQVGQAQTAAPPATARKNLKITTTSITAATITADELILEDPNGATYRATNVSVSYATGTSGANGLDTGTITASNWYFEWVIFNPFSLTVASLLSLSSTAPTMPSGYTFKARVGASYFDAGSKLRFKVQYDRVAQTITGTNPTTTPIMFSGSGGNPNTPTWVALAVGSFVPPTASKIRFTFSTGSASNYGVASNNSRGAVISITNPPQVGLGWASVTGAVFCEMILESTNIYYAFASTGAIAAEGWEDNL